MDDYVFEISDAIIDGTLDEGLDEILQAINERRKALQHKRELRNKLTLKEGDRVKLVNVSPKKMNGATGTMAKSPFSGKLGIKLDYASGRFTANNVHCWPMSCYIKMADKLDISNPVQYNG